MDNLCLIRPHYYCYLLLLLLFQLWKQLKPEEELTNRISKQWTEIGFQGDDPMTDFRGYGATRTSESHVSLLNPLAFTLHLFMSVAGCKIHFLGIFLVYKVICYYYGTWFLAGMSRFPAVRFEIEKSDTSSLLLLLHHNAFASN